MKRMVSLLLALVLALVLAGCGASKAAGGASDSMAASEPETGYWSNNSKSDDSYDEDGYDAEGEPAAASDPASRPVKMIYNGYMEMQTQDFDAAASGIEALVRELGGYFQQSSVSNRGSSSYRYGSYTIRIPAAQFETFFQRAGQLCHVTYTNTTADDVSESYYDTEARLETARIKLERLQELLKKAESMEDIITIESAISETEYEIEELSGAMRHYDALVDYATVTLELSEVYRLSGTEDAPRTFGEKLGSAFSDGLSATGQALEDLAVWLAYSWLGLLIFAAAVFGVVKLILRLRRSGKLPQPGRKKRAAGAPANETKPEE